MSYRNIFIFYTIEFVSFNDTIDTAGTTRFLILKNHSENDDNTVRGITAVFYEKTKKKKCVHSENRTKLK